MKRPAALGRRCSHRFSPNFIGRTAQLHEFRTWLGLGPNHESDSCYYPDSHHDSEHLHETSPYAVPLTITLQLSRASFRSNKTRGAVSPKRTTVPGPHAA